MASYTIAIYTRINLERLCCNIGCNLGYYKLNVVELHLTSVRKVSVMKSICCKTPYISWVLYFAVFPMNVILLEFNFVTFLQCTAKMFTWYFIARKQFIREINPIQNLRLLQYFSQFADLSLQDTKFKAVSQVIANDHIDLPT